MTITDLVLIAILVADLIFAITIVFFERKSPADVWAWLLVLYFLPVLGFVLYIFLGQNYRKKKMFRLKQDADRAFMRLIELQKSELKASEIPATDHLSCLVPPYGVDAHRRWRFNTHDEQPDQGVPGTAVRNSQI